VLARPPQSGQVSKPPVPAGRSDATLVSPVAPRIPSLP
jgi:hypothetical protein